ncbi:MAG TPA: MHYT domain-containing protein, partial [Burkholderiaceae bacterium]|nr:MHYT domain-containing protein [Burkholderiaceae bacterium]
MQYLSATYNLWGVVASVLIASFASYVTLDLAKRVHLAEGGMAVLWWAGGSLAMGTGIWSMHFIGMLAFTLPIPLGYTGALTLLSWLAAVGASSVALWTAVHGVLSWKRLIGGALAMGAAICAMHYTGMAGLDMSPGIVWNPWLVAASAVVAVAAAAAALRIFFWLRGVSERRSVAYQVAAAVLMGLAISGMHYTGMAAAGFPAGAVCLSADALSGDALGYLVVLGSVTMLALTLFTSSVDARAQRNQRAASRLSAANAQLEAAGREVRARLEAVFEHAPNGYILFDRQRGIGQCNPAAVKLFAAPGAESLSGRALWLAPLSPPNQADGRTSEEAAQAHLEQQQRSGDRVLSFE